MSCEYKGNGTREAVCAIGGTLLLVLGICVGVLLVGLALS